jgi:uncharacterized repeat protein (TIGR03803 family)
MKTEEVMRKVGSLEMACIVFVFCIAIAIASPAQTFTTVLSFGGIDGAYPSYMSLIQSTDGNMYGTTTTGGTYDQGTVFKVTAAGTLTTLYSFCAKTNCTDGAQPQAGLVQAANGDLYGTTFTGGTKNQGTVFKITSTGQLTTLHSFVGVPTDGAYPEAPLVQYGGNLYGTTSEGGTTSIDGYNYSTGTIFEVAPSGKLTLLHSFCSQTNCADGSGPEAGLVEYGGNFYGTTSQGAGTVFEMTPAGQLTTLYTFCSQNNCTDGQDPLSGLVQGTGGNFYGTTYLGGTEGSGTVFEITPAGNLTTLYSFCSKTNCTDGANPIAGLIQATDGNFFGTTQLGGTPYWGTVFKITSAGVLTTLHAFTLAGGGQPYGGLVQATNGDLYGTTANGGGRHIGTLFTQSLGTK